MDKIELVDTIEVKRSFLLANAFKGPAKKHRELGLQELEKEYQRIKESFWTLREEELDGGIQDKVRLRRYNSMVWCRGERKLEEAGVWPKTKGLDIMLTTGNVPETVNGIKKVFEGKSSLDVPGRFREKIASIRDLTEFIYPRFPLIFFPGGEVREKDYNVWARENDEPVCRIFKYDIDDGSSRAVAYCFEGLIEMPVFIGEYKKD